MEIQEKEAHLLDYWRIVVKRRWLVYTSLSVVVTVVTLGSLLTDPIYTATTRLQIERSAPNMLPFQQVMAPYPDQLNDFYQTQYGLIQSRRVAREAVASLELARHPEFLVRDGAPGAAREDGGEARRIDLFLSRLKVTPVRSSRLVDVSFSVHDRDLAARAANRVAETYIAFNSEAQYNTTERASTSMALQVANLREEIEAKEKALQAYAREQGIIPLDEKQSILSKNLNDLSDAATQVQAARIEKEARWAALRETSPAEVQEVRESPLIQELTARSAELARRHAQLSGKYKPEWPEMAGLRREMEETDRRLEGERRAIYEQVLGAAAGAYRAAANEEQYLRSALEDLKSRTQEMALKEIEYNNLKLDVANRRATIETLMKRQSEASTSAGMNDVASSNVRIVDPAETPARPSSPNIPMNVALSVLAGLGLGLGLAFFFEYMDKSVKSAEDLQAATGVPPLVAIHTHRLDSSRLRLVKANGSEAGAGPPRVDLIAHEDPKSKISEAFREMRTALLVSRPGGPPRTILITSSQPGEGKTAVSLNLSITLAQLGRRVLVVDGDLRRPRLHKAIGVPAEEGLSNDLSGTGPLRPRTLRTPIAGLDILPSGPLPPNPADLLDSERFDQLIRSLEAEGYDHVVFDSPPVLLVADPAIMAARMDAVVVVVRAGVTSRDALAHAVRKLQQMKARIVGGALNWVDLQHQGYDYGYAYKRYYYDETEKDEASRPAVPAGAARWRAGD